MISKDKHRINIVLPEWLYKAYVSAYPSTLSQFIRNALGFAVQSKDNFDQIFFKSYDNGGIEK